jgi:dipeptide/tripeptide permease
MIASAVAVLAALMVLTAKQWRGWHTGLFLWGLGLVLVGVLYAVGSEQLALRMMPDASEAARARLRSRQRVNELNIVIMGVGAAVLAAGSGWVAVDAGFTALLVVGGGMSTLVGVQAIRRRRAAGPG